MTVSPGAMQLEIGWTYTRDDETGFERRSHALPQTLVRVGVVPRLEARFGLAGWIRDEVTDAAQPVTSEGIGDLDLGFKYQIVDGGGTSPDVAVLTAVSIPTGEDQVGAFIESFGTFALDSDGSSAHSVDGGFTWGVRDNVQFDFAGGVGLNDAADDWFVGAGISLRVPR